MEASLKKIALPGLILASVFSYHTTGFSMNLGDTEAPETFLGPTESLNFNGFLNDGPTAYSVSGEAGNRNFRLGGVLGWSLTEKQRFKLSAEYLRQNIEYAFFSGHSLEWVSQGAVGAAWQYDFTWRNIHPQFNLNSWLSYAPSHTLEPFTQVLSPTATLTNTRRLAGSDAVGISPGVTVTPWKGGNLTTALIYDSVRYNTQYATDRNAIGFGGSVAINQLLTEHISLGVLAAARQPFDNYAATLSYNNAPYLKGGTLTLYGEYTSGRKTLPNTYNAGLSATFFIDQIYNKLTPALMKLQGNSKPADTLSSAQTNRNKVLTWTTMPAVYMPQVLVIPEEQVTLSQISTLAAAPCPLPTLVSPIPNDPLNNDTINLVPYFRGDQLKYDIVSITPGLGGSVFFDSTAGTFGYSVSDVHSVVVSVSNACGTVNSNPFTIGNTGT